MKSDFEKLLVIVTGQAGAGKSQALKNLEDLSFYCIDRLPLELLEYTMNNFILSSRDRQYFGVVIELRSADSVEKLRRLKEKFAASLIVDVLNLRAKEEIILQRYRASRRKHPFLDEGGEIVVAIRREEEIHQKLSDVADLSIDTSHLRPQELTQLIERRYLNQGVRRNLHVSLVSFGFKYGLLLEADSIFDARFLKNPYFDLGLRPLSGLDLSIQNYVLSEPMTKGYLKHLEGLLSFVIPASYAEGKHYFRVGIGCTGGRHRSVALAEKLAEDLSKLRLPNTYFSVLHRDIDRDSN